jgi:hypothetical protein
MRVSRPPGPPLAISIVVLVAGFVTALTGGIGSAVTAVGNLATVSGLPAVVHRHLDSGRYDVYQSAPTTLTAADVSVTAPDGTNVPVLPAQRSTFDFDRQYVAVAEFAANAAGDYVVAIRNPGSGGTHVLVARSGGDLVRAPVGWLVVLGAGGLASVVGLILIIVGVTRRDRAARVSRLAATASGPILVPAGWYPDPGGNANYRWWDGARWTDHTA